MLSDLNVATHGGSIWRSPPLAATAPSLTVLDLGEGRALPQFDPSYSDRNGELRQALPRVAAEDTAKWKCVPLGTAFIWTNQIVLKHSHNFDGSPNSQALWS
jgi:hypothetical protein